MDLSSVPMWKRVLAGCGLLTLVVSAVVITTRVVEGQAAAGPSELTLHPERQDEILADRRADTLGQRLGMDAGQTAELARIIEGFQQARIADRQQYAGNLLGLVQARRAAMQDLESQVKALLTAGQLANYANVRSELMGRVAGLQQLRPMIAPNLPELPLPGANPTVENTP